MTEINWSDLVDNAGDVSFEALPESDYDMVVKECDFKRTAEKNKKMYVLKAAVESGQHKNRVVWDNLVVSPENPNALSIFFRKMAALGIPSDFFKTNPTDDAVCQAVTGRRFRAHVNQRTWQGSKKNGIASYFPPSQAGVPPSAQSAPPPAAAAPPPPQQAPAAAAPPPPQQPTFAPEQPAPAPAPAAPQPTFTPEPAPVSPPQPAQPVQDPWQQPVPAAQFPTEQPAQHPQATPPPEAAAPPPPPPPPPTQATQEQQAPAAPAAAPASPF